MATKKDALVKEKVNQEQVRQYQVIGKRFKSKQEASDELKNIYKKSFKNTRFMVQGKEFIILFGTYATEEKAKKNADAIKKAGFTVTAIQEK